jgi:prepilin-type N-terminal cleavage/methylation domain-containing protein/prepilin-type processing-associated H-X9-DG protein
MKSARGFTMVELLVVIAILAVLAAVSYPVTQSLIGKSREAACLKKLHALGVGLQGYLQDHADRMPELASLRATKADEIPVLEVVLLPYVGSEAAFHCPEDHAIFAKSGSSYVWNSTQNGLLSSQLVFFGVQGRPDKIPLIIDKEAWHPNGSNFLFADLSSSNKPRFSAGK